MKRLSMWSTTVCNLSRNRASYNDSYLMDYGDKDAKEFEIQEGTKYKFHDYANPPKRQSLDGGMGYLHKFNQEGKKEERTKTVILKQQKNHNNQRQQMKEKNKQFQLGVQLKNRLELLMRYDEIKTIESKEDIENNNVYLNIQQPLIPCSLQYIHPLISQQIDNSKNSFYNAGVLPSLGFSYYSINDEVYFQDLVRTGQSPTDNRPIRVQFNNQKVLYITSGSLKSSVINQGYTLLFVLHPGNIGIYKYKLKQRQINVQPLGIYFNVSSCASQIIVSKSNRLFYMNKDGIIIEVNEKSAPRWRKPFSKNSFYLTQNKQNYGISSFVKRAKQSSIFAAFSELAKVTGKTMKQVYHSIRSKNRIQVVSFVINEQDNTLASLVNKGYQIQLQCHSLKNSTMQKLLSITQNQIALKLNLKEYMSTMGSIVNISSVSKITDSGQSNYMLSIKDGSRVFVNISKDKIKMNRLTYPPNIKMYNPPSSISLCDYFKVPFVEQKPLRDLINMKHEGKFSLMTFQKDNQNSQQTYLIEKSSLLGYQTISKIELSNTFDGQQFKFSGVLPIQQFLPECNRKIFQMQSKNNMKTKNKKINFSQMNELALQVYCPPFVFYFINGIGTQLKYKMRPIDIVFCLISNQRISINYCEQTLSKMLESRLMYASQIQSMLFQILLDKYGEYYVQSRMLERIQQNYEQFAKKQRPYLAGQKIRSVTTKIPFSGISNYIKNRVITLIQNLNAKLKNKRSIFQLMLETRGILVTSIDHYYHHCNDAKQQGLILFLTRLLRPIWLLDLKQIALNIECIYMLSDKLVVINKQLTNNPIGVQLNTKTSSNINTSLKGLIRRSLELFEICKIFSQIPSISFSEALYMTPEFFQQYIFQSLVKGHSLQRIEEDCLRIPSFIKSSISKVIAFYRNLSIIQDTNTLIKKVQSYPSIPSFVHLYLLNHKNFPKHIYVQHSNNIIKKQLIQEFTKYKSIDQKMTKLKYAFLNQVGIKSSYTENNMKTLYIQAALLNQYHQKQIELKPEIITKLYDELFTLSGIRTLVDECKSRFVDIVYMINMDNKIQIQQIENFLNNFVVSKQKQQQDGNMKKTKVIQMIEKLLKCTYNPREKSELTIVIIEVLSKIHRQQKQFAFHFKSIIQQKRSNTLDAEIFWVPFKLLSWGYSIKNISNAFSIILNMTSSNIKTQSINYNPFLVYSLLISYCIILQQSLPLNTKSKQTLDATMKWIKQNNFLDEVKYERFTNYLDLKLNGALKRLLENQQR